MTATLQETLLAPGNQPKVIADSMTLIQQELAGKSGISGTAVKLAYKAVLTFSPDHIRYMVETLLPKMADELEPYWADFSASDGAEFGDYLVNRGDEVSQSLLSVTDQRAEGSSRPAIVKAYRTVRPSAFKNVEAALPRVGALVQKYAGPELPGDDAAHGV